MFISSGALIACTTPSEEKNYHWSSKESNLVASPAAVVYSPSNIIILSEKDINQKPIQHIENISVDVYNEYGIRRQKAQIDEILKEKACELGGNAIVIINTPEDTKHYCAEVVLINAKMLASNVSEKTNSAKKEKSP